MQGSVFAIDRALIPQHRHIIVAEVDGELVLRRLLINPVPVLKELRRDENHYPARQKSGFACMRRCGLCAACTGERIVWTLRPEKHPSDPYRDPQSRI